MALIHKATLTPSKLDLLTAWLPSRSWYEGDGNVEQLASYRFDDPLGEVGMETFLLTAGDGAILQVPLTYRAAPIPDSDAFLVGTTEHSVLGTRWVYDGCADPAWVSQLATAIVNGGTQAELLVDNNGQLVPREPSMTVKGSGAAAVQVAAPDAMKRHDEGPTTVIRLDDLELTLVRTIGTPIAVEETLVGRWPGGGPAILAGTVTL